MDAPRLRVRSFSNARPLVWAFGDPAGSANRRVELYVSCAGRAPGVPGRARAGGPRPPPRAPGFEAPARRGPDDYARPPPGVAWYADDGGDPGRDDDSGDDDAEAPPPDAALRGAVLRQAMRGVRVPRRVLETFLDAADADDDRLDDLEALLLAAGALGRGDGDDSDPDDRFPPDDDSDDDDDAEVERLRARLAMLAEDDARGDGAAAADGATE